MSSHDRKNNQHKEPEPRHCQEQKRKLKNSQPAKKPRTTTKRSRLKDDIQPYDSGALVAEMTALMNLVKKNMDRTEDREDYQRMFNDLYRQVMSPGEIQQLINLEIKERLNNREWYQHTLQKDDLEGQEVKIHRVGTEQKLVWLRGQRYKFNIQRLRKEDKQGNKEEIKLQCIKFMKKSNDELLNQLVRTVVLTCVSTRDHQEASEALVGAMGIPPSKSTVSRLFEICSDSSVVKINGRSLAEHRFIAIYMDTIYFQGKPVIAAMGITSKQEKMTLGFKAGAAENSEEVSGFLNDLCQRGLKRDQSTLFVIDGSKALNKGITELFGDKAVIQRCTLHKKRNILGHIEKAQEEADKKAKEEKDKSTGETKNKAQTKTKSKLKTKKQSKNKKQSKEKTNKKDKKWVKTEAQIEQCKTFENKWEIMLQSQDFETAKNLYNELLVWLEENDFETAVNSLKDAGMKLFTVLEMGVSQKGRKTLCSGNVLDSFVSNMKTKSRRVTNWQAKKETSNMVERWICARADREEQTTYAMPMDISDLQTLIDALDQRDKMLQQGWQPGKDLDQAA